MGLPPGGREQNRGASRPGAGVCLRRAHFWTPKSGRKNRRGDSGPPLFVQSVCIGFDTGQPLKNCKASGFLVIGAVRYRTAPDGPRADRHFLSCETDRWFYPFNRPAGEVSLTTKPQIRCQRKVFQWPRNSKSDGVRLGKKRGPGCPRRRFGHFFAEEKVTRVRAGEAREKPGYGAG